MENFNPQFQKIGDILVYEKVITTEQLEKALSEQKSTSEKLGHILISQGSITEEMSQGAGSAAVENHRYDSAQHLSQSIRQTPLEAVCATAS